jgi:L-fuconolactonase
MPQQHADEKPLDPARPIIDPHLHLWDIPQAPGSLIAANRFLFEECQATLHASGHNITHTVFVECHTMYRRGGPPELKPVGETEFANGVAAMAESGMYGPRLLCHRIVGSADLSLGAKIKPALEAHCAAAGERFRGIRSPVSWTAGGMFGSQCDPARRHVLMNADFRAGARALQELDLSLDVWCFHTQLGELADLADALPGLTIILDHIGTPECTGAYADRADEARAEWAKAINELARRPNVHIKLGGMGMNVSTQIGTASANHSSEQLATKWRPYIETCIQAFTPSRCMFESNFPPDKDAGSYGATWNAFKRITQDYSEADKDFLFRRTAANVYRIAL